uniref:Reverse transcriptase RNase H-like domain-containing protein n=1 Tax=Tanacetum cinerariifolium TaxID=118510 RepID=A0A6L2KM60_TANCI|nr:hypothetical protein [Tanacetum cinerariifolium]
MLTCRRTSQVRSHHQNSREAGVSKDMSAYGGGILGSDDKGRRNGNPWGPTEPVLQTKKTPSPSPVFIKKNIDVLRTMIKVHDQQAKMKATPRKLAYADSDKEAPAGSLAKGFSNRFSLESSGTSDTRKQTRSTIKIQKTPSKNKEPTHLKMSRRLEDQSTTRENEIRERSKSRKRSGHQEMSSDFEYKEGFDDACEDLNSPYKRPKPTPFTQRITRFKYHKRAKLPRNIRVYEGNKDPEDHLGIFSAVAKQEEWPMPSWKQIAEVVASGKLAHLVKDIHRNNQRNRNPRRNGVKVINMIRQEENRKRSFEERRPDMMNELTFPAIPRSQLTDEPIILDGMIEGNQVPRILIDGGSSSKIMYEHYFRNPGVNIWSRLNRCRISMIGFSWETYHPLGNRSLSNFGKGRKKQDGANGGQENAKKAFTISHEHPDQYVTIGTTLTTNCKQLLADVLRENKEVFAWTRSERAIVPQFAMKHQLKIYPLAKLVAHKRRPMASEGRLTLKEKVFHWLKEGLISYSSLNKVCAKDMYPLPEEGEELASLMGYPYKCFLRLLKEYSQIRMAEDDEEKTSFYTNEGVYCFTHMPNELKKLCCYTLKDDGKGLSRSKKTERGNILGRNKEGLRADLGTIQAIILIPTPRSPNQIRSLFLQLTAIRKFDPKFAELKHSIRDAQTRMETTKESGLMNETEELFEGSKGKKSKREGIQIPVSYVSRPLQRMEICYTPTEKRVQALIYTVRSLRTVFRKHKVKVVTDGSMEETLKLVKREERLGKWATEIRTYDISYIQRKEAKGPVVKKFFG